MNDLAEAHQRYVSLPFLGATFLNSRPNTSIQPLGSYCTKLTNIIRPCWIPNSIAMAHWFASSGLVYVFGRISIPNDIDSNFRLRSYLFFFLFCLTPSNHTPHYIIYKGQNLYIVTYLQFVRFPG